MDELTTSTCWTVQEQRYFGADGEHYMLKDLLGEGGYGSVYRCVRGGDGADLAVKIIDPRRLGFGNGATGIEKLEAMTAREVSVLRQLGGHPGIVALEAAFRSEDTRQIFIVTEFVAGGDLFSHVLHRTEAFEETEASHIACQLADALSFCHAQGVVHRDIKLENVLVSNVEVVMRESLVASGRSTWQTETLFSVKIGDFGFAKTIHVYNHLTPGMLTKSYAAPECMQHLESGGYYDAFKADSYSLGVIVFVLLTLSFPDKDGSNTPQVDARRLDLSSNACSFVNNLLAVDPAKRLDMKQVCCHQWLLHKGTVESANRYADWRISQMSTAPQNVNTPTVRSPSISVLLALHRGLVLMQRERGMACCMLAGTPSFDGVSISCEDQFDMHVQLTQKRICQARDLLNDCDSEHWKLHTMQVLSGLIDELKNVRSSLLATRVRGEQTDGQDGLQAAEVVFNAVFTAYNGLCFKWIEMIAEASVALCPRNSDMKRAALRYRLFCGATEQLGRERAFVCGHWQTSSQGPLSLGKPCSRKAGLANELTREELWRLAEICGARKVILGTTEQDGAAVSGDMLVHYAGLSTTLTGEEVSPLLSADDLRKLESIEERVFRPKKEDVPPIGEWFQTFTTVMNDIHSRIAINLAGDVHHGLCVEGRGSFAPESQSASAGMPVCTERDSCSCRAGLKKFLQSMVDRL